MPMRSPEIPKVNETELLIWIADKIKFEWDKEDIMLFNMIKPINHRVPRRVLKRKTGIFCPECTTKIGEDMESLKTYHYCQFCGQKLIK